MTRTRNQPLYDTVYYWLGGAENGEWARTYGRADLDTLVAELQQGGRVAYKGNTRIGPPEGPPKELLEADDETEAWELAEEHNRAPLFAEGRDSAYYQQWARD